jgi:hypothetical protein
MRSRDAGYGLPPPISRPAWFRRNGEIFGGQVTYQSPNVSEQERAVYAAALAATIKRCSPLPLSDSLGGAIAGRLFSFHFIDHRKQKKA